jgi:hypothetical protein
LPSTVALLNIDALAVGYLRQRIVFVGTSGVMKLIISKSVCL